MNVAVVRFPGSNCDQDCVHALRAMGADADYLWHKEESLGAVDAVVLPGGFSYGDYLRCGAIARFSPVMRAVGEFAAEGGMVLGICNGFQILCEAGLLPGALVRNRDLHFICEFIRVRVERGDTPFTSRCDVGQVIEVPIAHGEGNYRADEATLREIGEHGQVLLRYCDADGAMTEAANPNGSIGNIAGICNRARNVFGLMPHPERAMEPRMGSADGSLLLGSLLDALALR